MPNYPRIILLSFLITSSVFVRAQTGNYFLTHFSPGMEQFDYLCFDMAQNENGVMYFATKAGILEFNGRDWDVLEDFSAIYALQVDASGKIYWGGAKGFGYIHVDKNGLPVTEILSDSLVTNVFQALIVKDKIYFLTGDEIFMLNSDHQLTTIAPFSAAETFSKLFELFGVVYVSTDNGIYSLDGNKLVASGLNVTAEVVFAQRLDNNYVIATADNRLLTCSEDLVLKPIQLQDQAYVDASVIVGGGWLNRQLLALGTLRGGVIFVNPINGLTQEITNYSTGLPDNEVFELMTDHNNNVWVAHDYGFTKIAPYIPLNSFSHYKGLQGNLLCAYSMPNAVYVGTSLGLFKLEKVEVYDELTYYVNVPIRQKQNAKSAAQSDPDVTGTEAAPAVTDSKKRGLFGFLKRSKRSEEAETQESQTASRDAGSSDPPQEDRPSYRRVKKTEKVLRSAQFEFRKVQGIDAKITHLAEAQGRLLASGLGGLFEVKNLSAKPVLEEPIRYLFAPSTKNFAIVCTYNDDVRVLHFADHYVENVSLFSNLDDPIHHAFQGVKNDLWLCGVTRIYRAEINGYEVRHRQTIPLARRNTDETVGIVLNGEVVVAMADGFFQFKKDKGLLEKIDTLPRSTQYFSHNGNIIYRDDHGWNFLDRKKVENNLQLLNVFRDLRFIAPDSDPRNLWIISSENQLYKFFGNRVQPYIKEYPLYLRSIVHQDKKIVKLEQIIIDQEHSALKFEVVQPDYINPAGVEFRYLLGGMQSEWSDWSSNNNVISFPYLPTSEYILQVESRNIFGKITTLEPLSFKVLPPYWKRSWFYALEFAIFASLVILSFRLSTRFRIVSRLLSLLTIILLIEFIQTAINASFVTEESPVIDFFIQVIVALMILPVEGYLRNLMLRSLDSSGKFYQFIVPRKFPAPYKEKPEKFVKETTDFDT